MCRGLEKQVPASQQQPAARIAVFKDFRHEFLPFSPWPLSAACFPPLWLANGTVPLREFGITLKQS